MDDMTLEERLDQILRWLWDAEDDLGDLARLVETGLARQGMPILAGEANKLAHKWEFRRNKRQLEGRS